MSNGFDNAYVLENKYRMQKYHADVYLMSEVEIENFFNVFDREVLKKNYSGRPYVLPAFYRFMYCCGTRCREVRHLKCEDVHLDRGYIDIALNLFKKKL